MSQEGFILLWRSITEWEWYDDILTTRLFIHLLLRANHTKKKWRGIEVDRGQYLTGRITLAKETGLTEQQIRTSLKKLKSTSEIIIKATNRFSLITLCNYGKYQLNSSHNNQRDNQQSNQQLTNKQPATNQQLTITNELNEVNELNEEIGMRIPFVEFWELYNKKKGDRLKIEKKWNSLKIAEQEKIMSILPSWLSQFNDKQFQPYPATFLNGRRWEDEITIKSQNNATGNAKPVEPGSSLEGYDAYASIKEAMDA